MADWMSQMANAVEEHKAANAYPQEEVPTEPATSPRSQVHEAPVHPNYLEELRLPSLEYGPHPEPERFATRWISRDDYSPEDMASSTSANTVRAFKRDDDMEK